jgi:antitoxin VapB
MWLDGRSDSYHLVCIAQGTVTYDRVEQKTPQSTGDRRAVAEAKVFMTGRSQAVRLPKEYRVTGNSVYVKRLCNSIVLIPKTADRWAGLFAGPRRIPSRFCA